MRATAKTRSRVLIGLAFLLLELTSGRTLPAAVPQTPWSFFLATGIRIPQQEAVRKIYGNIRVPWQFGVRFRFAEHWGMDAGLTYLAAGGRTRIVGSDLADENYRTRLTLCSVQLGLNHQWQLKRFRLSAGAGGSLNFYREKWSDSEILQKGDGAGFWIGAGGEYPLFSRFFLLGKIEYSSIPTGRGSALEKRVNLGGGQLLLGVAVHL